MKRLPLLFAAVAATAPLLLTGCYSAVHAYQPPAVNSYALRNDYQVLGNVTGSSKNRRVLCFTWGDAGYKSALADAFENCPDADDVIDLYTDTDDFDLIFYASRTTRIYAKAIKYRKPIPKQQFD